MPFWKRARKEPIRKLVVFKTRLPIVKFLRDLVPKWRISLAISTICRELSQRTTRSIDYWKVGLDSCLPWIQFDWVISALKLHNAAKTSSEQIREDQIGRQLSRQRSSLDRIQQSSNVRQLSNDLQNLQRGIGASSRARTQEKILEESNKFTQQGLDHRAFSSISNINTLLDWR